MVITCPPAPRFLLMPTELSVQLLPGLGLITLYIQAVTLAPLCLELSLALSGWLYVTAVSGGVTESPSLGGGSTQLSSYFFTFFEISLTYNIKLVLDGQHNDLIFV